jgi:hypothetical protein
VTSASRWRLAGFHLAASVRFDLVLFFLPTHRTGQAHFAHPALRERLHDMARGKLAVRLVRQTSPNFLCTSSAGYGLIPNKLNR